MRYTSEFVIVLNVMCSGVFRIFWWLGAESEPASSENFDLLFFLNSQRTRRVYLDNKGVDLKMGTGKRKLPSRIRSIVRRARSRAYVFPARRCLPGLSVFQYDSLNHGEIRVLSFEKQKNTKAPVRLTIRPIARKSSINEKGDLDGKSE
jgi:hypothetical protein